MENALKNRSLLLFIVVLLFLALLAFYFGILKPSGRDVTAQNEEIKTLNNQITILTKKAAEKNANLLNFSPDKVQASLPLWDNTEQLTIDISKISQDNEIDISNLSYAVGENNNLQSLFKSENAVYPNVKEVKISVSITGTYNHIYNWINQLNELPRIITVESLSLEKSSSNVLSENKISTALNLTAYFDPSYKDMVKEVLVPDFNK